MPSAQPARLQRDTILISRSWRSLLNARPLGGLMELRDARSQLRTADGLLRGHRYSEALDIYEAVADAYMQQGFALKAIAIAKQVVAITDAHLLVPRVAALRLLANAYTLLGLTGEAESARNRLIEVEKPH